MKNILQKITDKYRHLTAHISNKGLARFTVEKTYNNYIRLRLYAAGLNFSKTPAQLSKKTMASINNDAFENQSSSYYDLKKSFSALPLNTAEICLLDIGCGSGRVVNYCMLKKIKSVTGIDLDENALALATHNCNKLAQKNHTTSFSIQKADATIFSIPENVNTVYMFNPFGQQTMQTVAQNIISHAQLHNLTVFVIYSMPAFKDIFETDKNCTKIYEEYNKDKTQCELCVFQINT